MKSDKRLKAEALFRAQFDAQGFISPTEVARALDHDISNTSRWMRAWYIENNIPRPKVARGGRTKAPYIRRVQETQLAGLSAVRAPGDASAAGSSDQNRLMIGGPNARPFDVFEQLDRLRLPVTIAFLPREGASMREVQDSAYLRALYLQMTDADAAAVAAISREEIDRRLADSTARPSGMTFADEARTARAMGQFTSLKTLSDYVHAYPTSSKALDLASWLLERRAPAFIRKTATAVAIAQDVHIRTARDDNPDSLIESIAAIQAKLARTRFGIAAHPPAYVIEGEVVEDDESA
jgi:hypothetical protein